MFHDWKDMEIYNETCYDLLDPKHEGTTLEDLPYVNLLPLVKLITQKSFL